MDGLYERGVNVNEKILAYILFIITLITLFLVFSNTDDYEPTLAWGDMNIELIEELAAEHCPESDLLDIEIVWRVADVMGKKRAYWVIREVK